jgi:uncharacterized membrane protein
MASLDVEREKIGAKRVMPLWLKYGAIGLIGLGVVLRFYNLDRKVYWIDETNSSLRTLGYTKTELIEAVFTGEPVQTAELRRFQELSPEKGWGDTWQALTGTAEHTPLYFLLARAWIGLVGHSVASMRALTALLSVLVFPALYWLCRELFNPSWLLASPLKSAIGGRLQAIAPVQILPKIPNLNSSNFKNSKQQPSDSSPSTHPPSSQSPPLMGDLGSQPDLGDQPDLGSQIGWVAMALFAITPVHLLYAQEARPYSLLSLMIVLSSALLLRAVRIPSRLTWGLYGLAVVAGLYTQLLFGLVVLAHAVYLLLTKQVSRAYFWAAGLGCLALLPWLIILVNNWQKVQQSTVSLNDGHSWSYIFDRWCLNLNLAFLSRELGAANILLVIATLVALYLFCRVAPSRSWLFVVLLVGVPFAVLALPDLLVGGRRSLRIRYLFPCFFGFQLALAYGFVTCRVWARPWPRRLWQGLILVLVMAGLVAAAVSAEATVWWNKSIPRSSYYPPVAAMINQSPQPLVISDGPVTDTLAFSAWLRPDVTLQLPQDRKFKVAPGYEPIYLLSPSKQMQNIMRRRGYALSPVYEDRADPTEIETRLWLAQKTASK